jgi:hypothetical protein
VIAGGLGYQTLIEDWFVLLRRVAPEQVIDDQNEGRHRPSSMAFKNREMSVDAMTMLELEGLDERFTVRDHPDHWVVSLTAQQCRELDQSVEHDPLRRNCAHVLVIGAKNDSRARALNRQSIVRLQGRVG